MEAEALPGTIVEFFRDGFALGLSDGVKIGALGQILANETVGVFVGAAFPGVMGRGKVDLGGKLFFDLFINMELGAVVGGDGLNPVSIGLEDFDGSVEGVLASGAGEFADADQAGFSFHDGDNAGFAGAMNRVDLPVADPATSLDNRRTRGNHLFAREPASTIITTVALAFKFSRAT